MKTTRPKIALSAFIAMKNKIYAVIAVLAVMILASCKEEDVYGGSKPMSWEIESTSGAAEVSVKKRKGKYILRPGWWHCMPENFIDKWTSLSSFGNGS